MFEYHKYIVDIFKITNHQEFETLALQAFNYQFNENRIYHEFCTLLKKNPQNVFEITSIPFLPVSVFKSEKIICTTADNFTIFSSSTTSGSSPSLHYVSDIEIYKNSFIHNFKSFYGNLEEYVIIALLPSYLERNGSSLVFMANDLINLSKKKQSGFFLNQFAELHNLLFNLESTKTKYLLLGVSFALLDFAEKYPMALKNGFVMETGGMKGRKTEITRKDLHKQLMQAFECDTIHSEYGMTELLSQAYSKSNGLFFCPKQMTVLVRDPSDPLSVKTNGKGALNIVDLANINSCCFIETSDVGQVYTDGSFEVSGRFDIAEIRGCNLLVSE